MRRFWAPAGTAARAITATAQAPRPRSNELVIVKLPILLGILCATLGRLTPRRKVKLLRHSGIALARRHPAGQRIRGRRQRADPARRIGAGRIIGEIEVEDRPAIRLAAEIGPLDGV